MNKFIIELSDLEKKRIWIGYEGEQNHTMVIIRCGAFFAKYPEASAYMTVKTPTSLIYPVALDRDENDLIWNVTRADVSIVGSGKLQLTFTNGTGDDAEIIKSVSGDYEVLDSLDPNGEAPDPVQNWIENAEQTAQEIAENAANLAKEDIVESYGSIAPAIIETASGAIASFSDGADGMLVKTLTVDIDPVQDLHGYDNPWPAGGGKNLCEGIEEGDISQSTGQNTDGESMYRTINHIPVTPNGNVSISGFLITGNVRVFKYGSDKTYIGSELVALESNKTKTIAIDANTYFIRFHATNYLMTNTTPIQAESGSSVTSYATYSNICPISGRTSADVTRTGKNLLNHSTSVEGYSINASGVITALEGFAYSQLIPVKKGETYTFSFVQTATPSTNYRIHGYDANGNWIEQIGSYSTVSQSTGKMSFSVTVPNTITFIRISYAPSRANSFMLEEGSTASEYEAYKGTTYTYTFPQSAGTVYGGTLTIHQDGTGTLVSNMAKKLVSEIVDYYQSANGVFYGTAPGIKLPATISERNKGIQSSCFFPSETVTIDSTMKNGSFLKRDTGIIYIRSTEYSTVEAFNEAYGNQAILYELATPVSYELTAQQVGSLLKGVNNVWADTGDVSLEYPADTKLYIDARVAELQALILENISNS